MFDIYWQIPHDTDEEKNSLTHSTNFLRILEENNVKGSLIYYHHTSFDPWMLATAVIHNTKNHIPLIAMQPYTMLPSTAATMIHSIFKIYKRKVNLNFITGNSDKDLEEVDNKLNKNERYERLSEFAKILRQMLSSNEPLTFEGKYYNYFNLRHSCALPNEMMPDFFIPTQSGSSEGIKTIVNIADVAVTIPKCLTHFKENFADKIKPHSLRLSVKIQIITRPTYKEAMNVAKKNERYNVRMSQIVKAQEKKKWLLTNDENEVYFPSIGPFGPLILGDYNQVINYLSKYRELGVSNLIISNINSEELPHIKKLF